MMRNVHVQRRHFNEWVLSLIDAGTGHAHYCPKWCLHCSWLYIFTIPNTKGFRFPPHHQSCLHPRWILKMTSPKILKGIFAMMYPQISLVKIEKIWSKISSMNIYRDQVHRRKVNALWVKGGNRGNLKCWKVNDHSALIFHRKIFISFLSDAKLQNFMIDFWVW